TVPASSAPASASGSASTGSCDDATALKAAVAGLAKLDVATAKKADVTSALRDVALAADSLSRNSPTLKVRNDAKTLLTGVALTNAMVSTATVGEITSAVAQTKNTAQSIIDELCSGA